MTYPEYRNTYFSTDGFFKGRPVAISSLPDEYFGEAYSLTMQYDDTFISHLDSGKKWKDYHGHRYAEYFPMDIDCKEKPGVAQELCISFLEVISQEHEIDLNVLKIYFSGSKGFHLLFPSILFNVSPHRHLEQKFKQLAIRLISGHPIEKAKAVDLPFYCKNRWLRIPNSLHPDTNLYKIPLTWNELKTLTIEEIKNLAKEPRHFDDVIPVSDLSPIPTLSEIWQECLFQPSTNSGIDVEQVLANGVDDGHRGDTAFLIIRVLRDQGVSKAAIRRRLIDWNRLNRPPISESSWLDSQIKSTFNYNGGSTFGRDSIGLRALLRDHLIFTSKLFSNAEHRCVLCLISKTNSSENIWKGVTVRPGQVITSHKSLGDDAHLRNVKNAESVARKAIQKLIAEGVLVKVEQLKENRGILYKWQGEFAEVFHYSVDHPFTSPPQITPTTAVTHTVSVNYDDTLKNLITPIDHLFMSSTKNLLSLNSKD